MRTRIVAIGNSQGVRIPKPLLEQSGLGPEVELDVEGDRIVIRRATGPREGWEATFEAMAAQGDDFLLDPELAPVIESDEEEWEW